MRTITIRVGDGIGSTAELTDENGDRVQGVTQIVFDRLNVMELWTGTLVFLHGATKDERVYLVTA
jgi:hypothetical protein